MSSKLEPNTQYVDLSGLAATAKDNPYDTLIEACEDDPGQIQKRYETHRNVRNEQQKARLLASNFPGMTIDPVLHKLLHPDQYPQFEDPRHNLVFWARPPKPLRTLVSIVQQKLLASAPNLWLMPLDCLHMTVLEITHSVSEPDVQKLVEVLYQNIQKITDYTFDHRARLIKPMIGYDSSALALSFLPAAGEKSSNSDDSYSYHHLRRDLFNLNKDTGVAIASRYTVPSSHLTIARFVTQDDFANKDDTTSFPDPKRMEAWIDTLEGVNRWLEETYWPKSDKQIVEGGEWIVGKERGLDFRKGVCWYGCGETVHLGKGF